MQTELIEKAQALIAKFNPHHDRVGRFARGPGGGGPGRTASMDGLRNAAGGGTGKVKTKAQKEKEVEALTDAQYRHYEKAPTTMSHDEAIQFARSRAPKTLADVHDPGPKPGDPKRNLTDMRKATDLERLNGLTDADGVKYRIPPAWRDVYVSNHPAGNKSGLRISGIDEAGRVQPKYTARAQQAKAGDKYDRVSELSKHLAKLDKHIDDGLAKGDPRAIALYLIRKQGLRPGSTADMKARKQAYGATTLEARHVTINKGSVRLQYVGKEGKDLDFTIRDPKLVAAMTKVKAGKRGTDPLFGAAGSAAKVQSYMREVTPGKFKLKDLRTVKANTVAVALVSKAKPPKNATELKRMKNSVADQVAAELGNTRAMALGSYINPAVFGAWEKGIQ